MLCSLSNEWQRNTQTASDRPGAPAVPHLGTGRTGARGPPGQEQVWERKLVPCRREGPGTEH